MRKAESRIALFYPWTGLPALDRGSARRVVPLVRLLAERYEKVRVVSPGPRLKRLDVGNIEYHFQEPSATERLCLKMAFAIFDSAFHRLFRGRVTVRERRQWWHYLSADIQWNIARQVRQTVAWASAVLLEYPFWEKPILASCSKTQKKSLLTIHDTLSDLVVHSTWLRAKVRSRELSAARGASCVFCVSERDRQNLLKAGIVAQFVPHGMDIEPRTPDPSPQSPDLQELEAARGSGKTVCLFVGSSLQTNQDAVAAICKMASVLAPQGNFQFVIAGACLPKGTYPNKVTAFGPVEESLLLRLYQLTDIVLAPLSSGTGASLKVLEAFVHGKALLSTSVGVRGHSVQDGRDCLVCDDLDSYPEIILALSVNPARRKELGEGGRRFVKAFDYRIVYQPYLEEIEKFVR